MKPILGLSAALLLLPTLALGALQTEAIAYRDGDTALRGYLVYDDTQSGRRPGILVAHEWWGLNDYIQQRARMLAELG